MKVKRNKSFNMKIHSCGDLVTLDETGRVGVVTEVELRPMRMDGAFYTVLFPKGPISNLAGYMLWPVE